MRLSVTTLLIGVLVACGPNAEPPLLVAQVDGAIELSGLSAPVRVVRDRAGVPHIYAETRDDLFAAQGFVQAQDRLFQMDLWRRSAQGRLAEVLGPNFIERDAMTRRFQYRGDVDVEWASYGPDAKAIAEAFVRGINAWVALARARPPEAFALAGWKPSFWSPVDLLSRTDLFVASRKAIDESTPSGALVADAIRRVGVPPFFAGAPAESVATRADNPSPRYLVHLNAPGWNMTGATPPWLPGVGLGHDDRGVWDATVAHVEAPATDAVKINPDNPHQVDEGGRWVDTELVRDAVVVKGRKESFFYTTDYSRRGVIVATDRERHLAFAVRWNGTGVGAIPALHVLTGDRRSLPSLRAEITEQASDAVESPPVIFTHLLGTTAKLRARFNVGPVRPTLRAAVFSVGGAPGEWDRWWAMNAPGQSESPDSAHFGDLAALWAAGKTIPLPFSDAAVRSAAEATLVLIPRR